MADQPSPPAAVAAPPSVLIPGLPDDVALHCIARVPLSHHPTLSLVSKPWRSLLRSPLVFATRRRLKCSEQSLFLCLRLRRCFRWFALLTHTSPPLLRPLPPLPYPADATVGSAVAAVGTKIFVLGGSLNDVPSRNVWIYDSICDKWEPGRQMRVGREFAAAGTVSGKVYAIGGCIIDSWARSVNWAEVFDPELGFWSAVPSPIEVKDKWMHANAVMGGKIYAMADRGGVAFDPGAAEGESAWSGVSTELDSGWRGRAVAVGGVLYCYDYLGKIRGYIMEEDRWKELKGVEKGLPKFLCGATMASVGGKLVVVWEGKEKGNGKEMDIMCAFLEVRRDCDGELWGSIVWSSAIISISAASSIVHCLGVEL